MAAYDPNFTWAPQLVWQTNHNGPTTMPFYDDNWAVARLPATRVFVETFEERKRRIARERTRAAVAVAKLLSPEPLVERQYDRDRREGRAVGVDSRYRLMLC